MAPVPCAWRVESAADASAFDQCRKIRIEARSRLIDLRTPTDPRQQVFVEEQGFPLSDEFDECVDQRHAWAVTQSD